MGEDYKITKSNVFVKDKETGKYVSYTWHHDLKGDQMYLVKTDVHNVGKHMGPNSVINSLDKTEIDGGTPWDWRDKPKIDEKIENFSQYDESFVNKRSKNK